MKLIKICLITLSIVVLAIAGCKKKETVEPEPEPTPQPVDPYTYSADLQSSKDISAATYAILDIDMMGAFLGERTFNHFYQNKPSAAPINTCVGTVDTMSKTLAMAFNKTPCIDGKKRTGTVLFNYTYDFDTNRDAKDEGKYYRNYGFSARLNLYQYEVDDWRVELADPLKPANVINRMSSASYNPATENLTWEIRGKFKISNLTASGRDIVWDGKLTKTLTNTNDPAVFNPNKQNPINWSLAKVAYTGTITGTIGDVAYTYTIDAANPLFRNFNCNVVPSGGTEVTQFHPIIKGAVTFTWGNYHPRVINHGPVEVCDKSGTISFRGETYTIDFD